MKLIPAGLYEKLMQTYKGESQDEEKQKSVFDLDIPDELKASLFQELKRNVATKQKMEKERPLAVKDTAVEQKLLEQTTQLGKLQEKLQTPRPEPEQRIVEFLKNKGITTDEKNQVVINGKPVTGSDFERTIKELSDARKKRGLGAEGVVVHLKDDISSIPQGVFSAGIMKAMSRLKQSSNVQRNLSFDDSIPWDAY